MDNLWITVEKQRKTGDISLGISQVLVKSFHKSLRFPQSAPQVFISFFIDKVFLVRKVICNYKEVISLTHLSTPVITTNFKYKFSRLKVPSLNFKLKSLSVFKSVLGAAI